MLRRPKREERPLLIQERPVLSDEIPGEPEEPQKKRSWRKRLFGKKKKSSFDENGDNCNEYEVPNLSKSSSSTLEKQRQQSQSQQPAPMMTTATGTENTTTTNPIQNQREKRDDSTTNGAVTPSPPGYSKSVLVKDDPPEQARSRAPDFVKKIPKEPPTSSSPASSPEEKPRTPLQQEHKQTEKQRSPNKEDGEEKKQEQQDYEQEQEQEPQQSVHMDHNNLASPQPTVMSTFSKKKTPRAKGGISAANHGRTSSQSVALLKRPFGRDTIKMKQPTWWMVNISAAEWEPEQSLWKYRIAIQKRTPDGKLQDSGSTFRSLFDFHWLERALQTEFNGGLLLPSLSISLGVPDLESCQHEVDARLLTNWLSDVLNGVRGQGEMIYDLEGRKTDLITSESMEAFLYRIELNSHTLECNPQTPILSPRNGMGVNGVIVEDEEDENSKWSWMYPELCGAAACVKPAKGQHQQNNQLVTKSKLPLRKMNCASAALGDARAFNVQDSFVETAATFDTAHYVPMAIHSDLLKAEKDLVWSWRTKAMRVMEKMRILQEQEKQIGAAWKRFAISLSNLFAYEKDVESAKMGDSKARQNLQMPYRKLQKSTVDDCLRILARQKVERSTPSLESLGLMLSAYVADLSAVQPSVQAYLEGLQQLAMQKDTCDSLKVASQKRQATSGLAGHLQVGFLDFKKTLGNPTTEDDYNANLDEEYQMQLQQLHIMESRVLMNESLLKDFLTTLCQTACIRTARMAYAYFVLENKQCGLLHGAAINMKNKINVATKESLTKMIQRHHREHAGDRMIELQIVQRVVNLNNTKKFLKDDGNTSDEVEQGVEVNKDGSNEEAESAKLRDKALKLCRDRVGRWDAKLALALMEAVGVTDANVRVEETTRDLRMVRKYAIGLRENVQRCSEALESLRSAVFKGEFGDIRDLRHDFMAEIQDLFSTIYVPTEDIKTPPSIERLERAGIRLDDPSGWRMTEDGTCGGATKSYMENRESSTEWLLDSLGGLLKEYDQRIEAIESFVYMECVGIQLEKHFSQKRATALAAFEKKTDITSAINIATRKRMPALVKELQAKLADVGADVSHTTVKETKEAHLDSKQLKQELHDLGMRRLTRSQETSTERVIAIMTVWSKEDEGVANNELNLLQDVLQCLENSLGDDEIEAYEEVSPAPLSPSAF